MTPVLTTCGRERFSGAFTCQAVAITRAQHQKRAVHAHLQAASPSIPSSSPSGSLRSSHASWSR